VKKFGTQMSLNVSLHIELYQFQLSIFSSFRKVKIVLCIGLSKFYPTNLRNL